MMQVQMPIFAKISSDFVCIYEKIASGVLKKVLEFLVIKRVGTLCCLHTGRARRGVVEPECTGMLFP